MRKKLTWTRERIKKCPVKDLRKMTFAQLIKFCRAAMLDWPDAALTTHQLWTDMPFEQGYTETGRLYVGKFKKGKPPHPSRVSACAVGVILMSDGAAAAYDIWTQKGTGEWRTPEAQPLFQAIIAHFDSNGAAEGKRAVMRLLALCERYHRMDPAKNLAQVINEAKGQVWQERGIWTAPPSKKA